MNIEQLKKLLDGAFVERPKPANGVCFAIDYLNGSSNDKDVIYHAISNAMHKLDYSMDFSYDIASKAIYVLTETEDWNNEDLMREAIENIVPVYTHELMTIYPQAWDVVDEAIQEYALAGDDLTYATITSERATKGQGGE